MWLWFLCVAAAAVYSAEGAGAGAARLVCYVESARESDFSECTHLIYTGAARGDKLDSLLKEYRKNNPRLKIVLRVAEVDKDLPALLKSKHVQGLEIHDAHRSLNKTKVLETVEDARSAINSAGGGPLFLALPAHPELLAKYYDLRTLVKKADLMMVQTHALGLVKKMTYHPSRLSGLWDMMNTDSVVDLAIGLGIPASKVVVSLPATARQFTLLNETLSTPGSPTTEDEPKEIDQAELCRQLRKGRWTLERDQDLSAPYAFKDKTWISFEDASSVDVKGKYARVRGLAGLALHQADRDAETPCGPTLKAALAKVLNQQSRAPRAAVLRSLENEILAAPSQIRALDALQVSPYRITQVVDSDGVIHSIREDTRTEFSCSRQGYFVHPRSCARFYRCVKFDQLSPDYTVFEFDCPAGLAFDARYEVCVWPGSLPNSQACPGSSEIAPVPATRFICPDHEGYYADPENCRWFFACLDHGKAPMTAYEFRCPFGLGFDAARLKCDWPWLVPACGNIARYEAEAFGFSGAALSGALGFQGRTADSINVAAHQSLASGAALDNLVGIQGSFLTKNDALDVNFIESQEIANQGLISSDLLFEHENAASSYSQIRSKYDGDASLSGAGLVQATNYEDYDYASGSLILDDYRLPAASAKVVTTVNKGAYDSGRYNSGKYNPGRYSGTYAKNTGKYQQSSVTRFNSGKYVHNPAGDKALPYDHVDSVIVPYVHVNPPAPPYKPTTDYSSGSEIAGVTQEFEGYVYGPGKSGSGSGGNGEGTVATFDFEDKFGGYFYGPGKSGSGSGETVSKFGSAVNLDQYSGSYTNAGAGEYVTDSKAYTGASHTLTAGAINVGLVGKTSLVDAAYTDQGAYQEINAGADSTSYTQTDNTQTTQTDQISYISQPAVSINHAGTATRNLDGYSFVTNPTSSGVPTTATPFAVTTAIPVTTYKTTYIPQEPKTTVKEVFGFTQPAVTFVQPVVTVKQQYVPRVELTDYSQASSYADKSETGYEYSKPAAQFEEGISYTTQRPITVSTYKPRGFAQSQQTVSKQETTGYQYTTPTPIEEPVQRVVTYNTGPSVATYVQPTGSTFTPQAFSQQTINKVESGNGYTIAAGQGITNTDVTYEVPQTVVQYNTPQPAIAVQPIVSTYQPQAFSQQTIHKVDASKINAQAEFETGYEYRQPNIRLEEVQRTVQYSTPIVTSTYRPQSYSQQTVEIQNQRILPSPTPTPFLQKEISYQPTQVTIYENPILKFTQRITPQTYDTGYTAQSYNQQTLNTGAYTNAAAGNNFETRVTYEQPKIIQYTTAQPAIAVQPAVSTYQPQAFSQQTIQKLDAGQVNTYSGDAGYTGQRFVEVTTPVPIASSTYRPKSYSPQTFNKIERQQFVSSTPLPAVDITYQQPAVTVYENPILKYTKEVAPVTYVRPTAAVYTQTPLIQQTFSQPEIQRETSNTFSDATLVSHQVFHQSTGTLQSDSGKDVVYVSTTPSTLAYEDHYTEYKSPKVIESYKAPEYLPPKVEYQQTYTASTPSTPVIQQSTILQTQDQSDYSQQYETVQPTAEVKQVTFSQPPKPISSFSFTSVPRTTFTTNYKQTYDAPEIQVAYKAEEYLPPVASTVTPIVTSTYRPRTYSTTASTREYLPPTSRPKYTAPEYLPPAENPFSTPAPVSVVSFGTKYTDASTVVSTFAPRRQNVVFETSQSNLLGFGTVGSDAGLVSTPVVISTTESSYLAPKIVTSTYAPELVEVTSVPTRRTRPKYVRPSTQAPSYLPPVESTTAFRAPEYLPPLESDKLDTIVTRYNDNLSASRITNNPYQEYVSDTIVSTTSAPQPRKQNIVVETAKSNLLGFGTVGPDAGLVTVTSPSTPIDISDLGTFTQTSSYGPIEQELVEITSRAPIRRTKPKVAVVTKINDFNPLLVRKLGAVCSCQSPVLVLKGRRPTTPVPQDAYDNSNDYEESGRGDIGADVYSGRIRTPITVATAAPVVTSTFNPIIVPDDSYYQDYQEASNDNIAIVSKDRGYSESYVSSTPTIISTTEKIVRIRPRVKTVTIAPTYKTVLLNQEVTPTAIIDEVDSSGSAIESQTFDRYGPGGWRGRDETLQGSVDCQRAGLFRHPKQCNKFYACRWDCTKQRFTLHVFNCPVQLSFDPNIGACNWPSQGPACQGDTLLTNTL